MDYHKKQNFFLKSQQDVQPESVFDTGVPEMWIVFTQQRFHRYHVGVLAVDRRVKWLVNHNVIRAQVKNGRDLVNMIGH